MRIAIVCSPDFSGFGCKYLNWLGDVSGNIRSELFLRGGWGVFKFFEILLMC